MQKRHKCITDINEMNYEWKHSKELNKTLSCVLCLGSCFLSRCLSLVEDDSGLQYLHIVPLHTHTLLTLLWSIYRIANIYWKTNKRWSCIIITTCEHNTRLWNGFRFDTYIQQPNEKLIFLSIYAWHRLQIDFTKNKIRNWNVKYSTFRSIFRSLSFLFDNARVHRWFVFSSFQ